MKRIARGADLAARRRQRRRFLQTAGAGAAVAGAALLARRAPRAIGAERKPDELRVALIGAGAQGQLLLNSCAQLPGVRVQAVCDIWEAYNLQRAARLLEQYKQQAAAYVDYRQLLDKERGLDAALIATPDCFHAEQTVACLEAGLHVYCEAPMALTVEDARRMVQAARQSGKLLQIGHQRRSNPYYRFCYEHVIHETRLLGKIVAANGQWNRPVQLRRGWPRRAAMDEAVLRRYGFASMDEFRNWEWSERLGAGPLGQLGVHQLDVLGWMLDAQPAAAFASGGVAYYDADTHQRPDTVMAVLEYPAGERVVRAFYQTISSNSNSGYYESFMGDQGTLYLSEATGRVKVFREPTVRDWDKWVRLGYLKSEREEASEEEAAGGAGLVDVEETVAPPSYKIPAVLEAPPHQPHVENFFQAVRGQGSLTCPAETALPATVVALRLGEAAAKSEKFTFRAEDFQA